MTGSDVFQMVFELRSYVGLLWAAYGFDFIRRQLNHALELREGVAAAARYRRNARVARSPEKSENGAAAWVEISYAYRCYAKQRIYTGGAGI